MGDWRGHHVTWMWHIHGLQKEENMNITRLHRDYIIITSSHHRSWSRHWHHVGALVWGRRHVRGVGAVWGAVGAQQEGGFGTWVRT